jgi:hypothetical protein
MCFSFTKIHLKFSLWENFPLYLILFLSQSINSADSSESEIQKATNEITRLREELSSTQRENLQLRVRMEVNLIFWELKFCFVHESL